MAQVVINRSDIYGMAAHAKKNRKRLWGLVNCGGLTHEEEVKCQEDRIVADLLGDPLKRYIEDLINSPPAGSPISTMSG
jgi:hypothetical protein